MVPTRFALWSQYLILSFLIWTCQVGACFSGTLRLLHSETDSFSLRRTLIAQSERSIDIASYEISDDDTSGQLLGDLLLAVERGVCVRVIADGHIGSNVMPKAMMQFLLEHGVSVREFPVDVRYQVELGRQRLHDKLFIVDNEHLITGGRNLEQEFFGVGDRKYIDRDVYVSDAAVVQTVSEYYSQRWNDCKAGQPTLHREENPRVAKRQKHPEWNGMERRQAIEQISAWMTSLRDAPMAAADVGCSAVNFDSVAVEDCRLRFLHDFVGKSKLASGAIGPEMLQLLKQARKSIDIETPYFAVSHELRSILLDATRRGVTVRILTNSLESTDQIAVHASYVNERRWMLRGGIELYELQGRNILHAKSTVVDGRIAAVGSYNWDMLSERRNSEVALIVNDSTVASQVSQSIAIHRAQAKQIQRGELFRYEARESQASDELVQQLRRLRWVTPWIKRYL